MNNTAVIIGSTGAVGKEILNEVLNQDYYNKVYILGRKSIERFPDNDKLEKIVIDFENLDFNTDILNDSDVFATLGTTIKIAKTKENQKKIDLDYTVNFAKLCEGKVKSFNVVSALGATSKSKNFYTSIKGKLEDELSKLDLGILRIYRPSLLIAKRDDKRLAEELFMKVAPIFKKILVGKFEKYKPIEVEILGKAIVDNAIDNKKEGIYHYSDFKIS
jgi:NAD-dependent epimerase/dehydratase